MDKKPTQNPKICILGMSGSVICGQKIHINFILKNRKNWVLVMSWSAMCSAISEISLFQSTFLRIQFGTIVTFLHNLDYRIFMNLKKEQNFNTNSDFFNYHVFSTWRISKNGSSAVS